VGNAVGFDDGSPDRAIDSERHGENGLQGIALGASGGRDIGFARRGFGSQVGQALDYIRVDARAIVNDRDGAFRNRHLDGDLGGNTGILARIECVIDKLLEGNNRPQRRHAWHTKTGTGSPVPWTKKAGKTLTPRKRGMIGSNL
jgi:hypothetical protein